MKSNGEFTKLQPITSAIPGNLFNFIEDSPTLVFPQTLSTERPDRVTRHLSEGRIALILEGNPFAQILPVSFFSFFHSGEDFSLKSGVSNLMRILRLFGALISTVLPSLYLSISYFHPEAMPTELLLAVAGSRENVPFPAWFEVLMMDISFELIREAGVRIPGILGSTIGIVGAIILGQAAVTARIVSPIVVVIIAITGLASFTIPEYRMASAVRLTRFHSLYCCFDHRTCRSGYGIACSYGSPVPYEVVWNAIYDADRAKDSRELRCCYQRTSL